jgi:4-amino-4-deoxy-L-arabinose transferase-like glycosyltransferase
MFIFFCALVILLMSSLPWTAVARPSHKPAWLMALYLIGSANVTLSLYIANSFYWLNQRWVILALHVLIGGIGWVVWKQTGKLSVWGPFQGSRVKFNVRWMRSEPVLALLLSGIVISYLFALVQIILIPQNNMDSLSTHLSRIGFWLQHGSFFPWQTTMGDQVWYPVNAQLQTYWTLLFLGGDRLVGSVQWLAALISGVGVFGIARLFDYNTRQSAFAALIFMSFPLVALQSTTTQTDLVTAVFFIPAVYFLILGIKENQNSFLTLSAISVGLGIGVKKSYFILLPVLAVMALLIILQFGKRTWKPLLFWSASVVIGIAIFGSYMYVVNLKYFGGLFGPPGYIENVIDTPQIQNRAPDRFVFARISQRTSTIISAPNAFSFNPRSAFLEVLYNAPRLFYQALDTSGLPRPLDGYSQKVKQRLAQVIFRAVGFEEIEGTAYTAPGHVFSFSDKNINEESYAWYGPLSALLIFPVLLIQSWRGLRKRDWLMLGPGLALLIFTPLEIIFRPGWDPFQGRYFTPLVVLCAPLMAVWFREKGNSIYEWLITVLAVMIVAVTLLYNPSKPTLGKFADEFHVWSNTRIFVQTIQRKDNRDVYDMVDKFVPADSTMGYYIPFFILDYPFFGENLRRQLVPLNSASQISDLQWLRAQGIEYLLLPKNDSYPIPPAEYQLVSHIQGWKLFVYAPTP